jgi:hypothetical protein
VTAWWRGLPRGRRVGLAIVGAILAVNLGLQLVGSIVGNDPSGPTSSSYATAPDGLAGLARLYEADGHRVDQLREALAEADLDPAATLVVADPGPLLGRDIDAVADFVRAGGRLVVAGASGAPLLQALVDPAVEWDPDGVDDATVLAPAPEVGGVTRVHGEGAGSWAPVGTGLPVLGGGDRVVALVADAGAGRVVALADATPLQNDHLADADAARFALAAAGEAGRPVLFDEASHGYAAGGAGVLPAAWTRALWVAFAAVLLLLWSRARRLGPPEEADRPLPPPRRAYVDALAVSLARTGQPAEALADLQARGRADLALRLGLPADARRDDVAAAARRVGVDEADVAALFDAPTGADDVIDVGRAAARHRGGRL